MVDLRAVFGVAVVAGFVLLVTWVVASTVAGSVAGWEGIDPDSRFGRKGRAVVAAVLGFGIAGISASYAGWAAMLATGAALAGALGAVVLAHSSE